ncbi:hypothetical protein Bpfe_029607 [Biomphalaria pfeifferi]|uniref:GDNF/GAS1 domain-containing protein n=1 Tax=Biomphalaria pfeifferi TaxID=112525 RepID=A0AAD8AR98_BIOPF|nr:hypothetical protein Bpfe_029607 [Biomphalaria pfeifferi]
MPNIYEFSKSLTYLLLILAAWGAYAEGYFFTDRCVNATSRCYDDNILLDCTRPEAFISCIESLCSSMEQKMLLSWKCLLTFSIEKIASMRGVSSRCASKAREYSFNYMPRIFQLLYLACTRINSAGDMVFFNESCSDNEFGMLVFEICDPWNQPLSAIISTHCQPDIDTCLMKPVVDEEKTVPYNITSCLKRQCSATGTQYLINRRLMATTELNEVYQDLDTELKTCASFIECYHQKRPVQLRWYDGLELNFTLCMGDVDVWLPCFQAEENIKMCNAQRLFSALGNLCFDRTMSGLGISFQCDRELSFCTQSHRLRSAYVIEHLLSCISNRCTWNEKQKIASGIRTAVSRLGMVVYRTSRAVPTCYREIVYSLSDLIRTPKMYDARTITQYSCFMMSSRHVRDCLFSDDHDKRVVIPDDDISLMIRRSKLIRQACYGLPGVLTLVCSTDVLKCIDKNITRCDRLLNQKNCLRKKCSERETDYILSETCRGINYVRNLRAVIGQNVITCAKRIIRCLDAIYLPGDEWYNADKVEEIVCSVIHSWNFQICVQNGSLCSHEAYMSLVMAACKRVADTNGVPGSNCLQQAKLCNFTFENSCLDLDNENMTCLRQVCTEDNVRYLRFKACKVQEFLGLGVYHMALLYPPKCAVAVLQCLNISNHWFELLANHRYLCSLFASEELTDCTTSFECDQEQNRIIKEIFCEDQVDLSFFTKECVARADQCFRARSCSTVQSESYCLQKNCTEKESVEILEAFCASDEYKSKVILAGGPIGKVIWGCALKTSQAKTLEPFYYLYFRETICMAMKDAETKTCAFSGGSNESEYDQAQVVACTLNFDHMIGISDICINTLKICLARIEPTECSQLQANAICLRNACPFLTIKYIVDEVCFSLDYMQQLRESIDFQDELCRHVTHQCFHITFQDVEIWMDVHRMQRHVCSKMDSEAFRLCTSSHCPQEEVDHLKECACTKQYERQLSRSIGSKFDVSSWLGWRASTIVSQVVCVVHNGIKTYLVLNELII